MRALLACLLLAKLFVNSDVAVANPAADFEQSANPWYLHGGPYLHFDDNENYEGPPLFLGIEYYRSSRWLLGASVFQNSYGQFSQYAYVGRTFQPLSRYPHVHIKLTGGIIHGYRGKHHDTLPVRWGDSWGIGVVPTVGYKKDRLGFDFALLKASGLMFLLGYHF